MHSALVFQLWLHTTYYFTGSLLYGENAAWDIPGANKKKTKKKQYPSAWAAAKTGYQVAPIENIKIGFSYCMFEQCFFYKWKFATTETYSGNIVDNLKIFRFEWVLKWISHSCYTWIIWIWWTHQTGSSRK